MLDQPVAARLGTGQTLSIPAEKIQYIDRRPLGAGDQDMEMRCKEQQD